MDWGLSNRLSRILKPPHGRTVMLAVDHGYFLGPTSGLEEPGKTIAPLIPYADSLMLTRGVLRTSVDAKADKPVVLRVSGGTSILKELSNEDITVSIDDCIRLNVSAMALSIFVGSEFEKETLVSLAKLVDEGEKYGIPVLAVTAVGKDMARDVRYLGLSCRIAAELGAHDVHVRMDSKLVVEQMSGRWQIKNEGLRPLAREAARLAQRFDRVRYEWIPRARNAKADALANRAMDGDPVNTGGPPPPVETSATGGRLYDPPADIATDIQGATRSGTVTSGARSKRP